MARLVCFIDKEGQVGTCTNFEIEGDCENCGFKKKYEGRESEEFSYTAWKGGERMVLPDKEIDTEELFMTAKEPNWHPMDDEMKIKNLERLVKALVGARGISYHKYPMGDGRIVLEDVYPEDIKFNMPDEYVQVEFVPEPFVKMQDDVDKPYLDARIDAWVYFWENPWDTIDELKEKLSEFIAEDEKNV